MSGRHEWHKRVKARERRTKRRTDTIGTRHEGCKVARGDCQACRKTKASQSSGRHARRKHVGKAKEEVCGGRQVWRRQECLKGMLYTAHMEARGREELMTCWGNAHETLRRHRWQKLVRKAREGHNKWRADTHGTYGGGCKYRAEQT